MNWQTLIEREPELEHIEHACQTACQQAATWYDFQAEHGDQIRIMAARLPTPSLRTEAISTIYEHLFEAWCEAMVGECEATNDEWLEVAEGGRSDTQGELFETRTVETYR